MKLTQHCKATIFQLKKQYIFFKLKTNKKKLLSQTKSEVRICMGDLLAGRALDHTPCNRVRIE